MAHGGRQRLPHPNAQKPFPEHKSALSRPQALFSPSSVLYTQLSDQQSTLDNFGASPQALGDGVQHSVPGASSVHESLFLAASKEMGCASKMAESLQISPEMGITKAGPTGGPSGETWGQVAGWIIDPDQITFCEHPVRGGLWQLGSGSYGVVYKARKGLQDVAVKTLHSHLMDPNISPIQALDSICRVRHPIPCAVVLCVHLHHMIAHTCCYVQCTAMHHPTLLLQHRALTASLSGVSAQALPSQHCSDSACFGNTSAWYQFKGATVAD